MLNGKCLILFISPMEFLTDEEGAYLIFQNETQARQYARKHGLSDYRVVGLVNGCIPDPLEGGRE